MFLGIDAGTSEIKAVVINERGAIIAESHNPLKLQRPHLNWSEQNPEDWWSATEEAIGQIRQKLGERWRQIKGIGLSGQMHGAVLLDKQNNVLRPAILWNDMRSAQESYELSRKHPEFTKITGNLVMPGFTAPKLIWVKNHEPEIFSKISHVLLPKDYLRFRMSGEFISDMSDASGTLWLDIAKRKWSEPLLSACELGIQHMPSLVEGSDASCTLSPPIAEKWGLDKSVIIAGGGGDNAASAVGVGDVKPDDAFISLGTSGVVFVVNKVFSPNPVSAVHAFCHALPQRWHQMSVMLSAASCLRWLCLLLNVSEADLMKEIDALDQESWERGPLFLPYLSGERTPHNDALASGSFYGLRHETKRANLGYAVLEGVAFGLADGLLALKQAGSNAQECSLIGGGAKSSIWAQILSDILDIPILTHKESAAGGALGAARLGWLACGGVEDDVCIKPAISQRYEPDPIKQAFLDKRFALFRLLYYQQKAARSLLAS
ncbi:xylulokinase [Entomobacter blattae]|uniref:Xylulose kinase n=1 Tax=Entomobacter blattae TaxID=2762277 RepID=A0A7H1NNM6_9PROT|nr:xylulokinase [Entomobacter blattae]QNT77386.1 Xylulose kinase [Entomobacter blattae]